MVATERWVLCVVCAMDIYMESNFSIGCGEHVMTSKEGEVEIEV